LALWRLERQGPQLHFLKAMPIYEYRCEQGHTFEVMQRMTDDPVATCQTCEAPVQRVFHPVAVHFKGSGFYNTDYGTRKRAREKAESGEGSSGSESKSESGSKSETASKSGSDSSSSSASKTEAKPAASSSKSDS
jgi:putative FmdB family regulatory protein